MISQFLWVRGCSAAWLGSLLTGRQQSRGQLGCSHLKLPYVLMGRFQFLMGCWMEDLSPLLVVDTKLPSVLCYMGLSNIQVYFVKVHKPRGQCRVNWQGGGQKPLKCRHTSDTCHPGHILFLRSKSLTQSHSREGDYPTRVSIPGGGCKGTT